MPLSSMFKGGKSCPPRMALPEVEGRKGMAGNTSLLTHHRSELKVEADNGREVKFHEPPVLVSNTEAYPVPGLTLGPVATKTKTMLTQPLSSRSLRT